MKCYACDRAAARACQACGRFCCAAHHDDDRAPRCPECRADLQFRMLVSGVLLLALATYVGFATPVAGLAVIMGAAGGLWVWQGWRRFRSAAEQEQAARGWPADVPALEGLTSAEPVPCLECGATIPPEAARCPACGWSYAMDDGGAGR